MSIQKICAGFETTLSAKILAAGMSFSLSTHVNKTGAELAGEYGFIWDEGTSTEEWGYGTILNGVVSVIKRGCDPEDPETEVTALKFDHSRGSSVKITDYPFLGFVKKYLGGEKGLPMPLKYATHQVPVADEELVDKKYVADIMAGVVGTATDINAGTIKTDKPNNGKPRAIQTLVQEQVTPGMTVKVLPFKIAEGDKIVTYAGGDSPSFIPPQNIGDLTLIVIPSDNETVTINGVVFTFKATLSAVAGQVLIGGTVAIARANLADLINNPGTTNSNHVALSSGNQTLMSGISSIDDLSTKISIKKTGASALSITETLAGTGNIWTLNTYPKIDILVYDTVNSVIAIRQGVTASSPTIPTPTSGDILLSEIYHYLNETSIKENSDSINGYIQKWFIPQVYRTDLVAQSYVDGKVKFGGDGTDGALNLYDLVGTGTISSSGTSVIGVGTLFTTELAVGDTIIVGAVLKVIATITDNTHLTVSVAYSPDISAQAFTRGRVATLDLASASIFTKNYSSISITGHTSLKFINPSNNGTIIILKSQGNVTLTSVTSPAIDVSGLGAARGYSGIGLQAIPVAGNGGGAVANYGPVYAGTIASVHANLTTAFKTLPISVGTAGGDGGNAGSWNSNLAGALGTRGGGALYIECGGSLNKTCVISCAAAGNAVDATNQYSGGAGGGAAGSIVILYNALIANSGTDILTGGNGSKGGTGPSSSVYTTAAGGVGGSNLINNGGYAGNGSTYNSGGNSTGNASGAGEGTGAGTGQVGIASTCGGGSGGGGAAGFKLITKNTEF